MRLGQQVVGLELLSNHPTTQNFIKDLVASGKAWAVKPPFFSYFDPITLLSGTGIAEVPMSTWGDNPNNDLCSHTIVKPLEDLLTLINTFPPQPTFDGLDHFATSLLAYLDVEPQIFKQASPQDRVEWAATITARIVEHTRWLIESQGFIEPHFDQALKSLNGSHVGSFLGTYLEDALKVAEKGLTSPNRVYHSLHVMWPEVWQRLTKGSNPHRILDLWGRLFQSQLMGLQHLLGKNPNNLNYILVQEETNGFLNFQVAPSGHDEDLALWAMGDLAPLYPLVLLGNEKVDPEPIAKWLLNQFSKWVQMEKGLSTYTSQGASAYKDDPMGVPQSKDNAFGLRFVIDGKGNPALQSTTEARVSHWRPQSPITAPKSLNRILTLLALGAKALDVSLPGFSPPVFEERAHRILESLLDPTGPHLTIDQKIWFVRVALKTVENRWQMVPNSTGALQDFTDLKNRWIRTAGMGWFYNGL